MREDYKQTKLLAYKTSDVALSKDIYNGDKKRLDQRKI